MSYLYSYGTIGEAYIKGPDITDSHLRYLDGFNDLWLLDINNTTVEGSFLAVSDLPSLTCLHITSSPVRDDAIPADVLRNLFTADFMGSLISNKTLRRLSMEKVHWVNIANTPVNAEGVLSLKGAGKLERVTLDLDDLTPEVIEMLTAKRSLRRVSVFYPQGEKERADERIRQLPTRITATSHEISPEDDYRARWSEKRKGQRSP
jgi:hypothetical protein